MRGPIRLVGIAIALPCLISCSRVGSNASSAVVAGAWAKSYGTSALDVIGTVRVTPNQGLVFSGVLGSPNGPTNQRLAWFGALTPNGDIAWQKKDLEPTYSSYASNIVPTQDGGYVVTGGYTSQVTFATDSSTIFLTKFDSAAQAVWSRSTSVDVNGGRFAVRATDDGGFFGLVSSFMEHAVFRLDSSGQDIWHLRVPGASLADVRETDDGGCIVIGSVGGEAWAAKFDSAGAITWQKTLGDAFAFNVQQLSGGGYVILAGRSDATFPDGAIWILALDTNGDSVWHASYGIPNGEASPAAIRETARGTLIVAGTISGGTALPGLGGSNVWAFEVATDGSIVWQWAFGGMYDDTASSLELTPDGGCLIAASTRSFSASPGSSSDALDGWILKLNAAGMIPGFGVPTSGTSVLSTTPVGTDTTIAPRQTISPVQTPGGRMTTNATATCRRQV